MKNILITMSSFCTFDKSPWVKLEQAGYTPILSPYGRKLNENEALALMTEYQPVGVVAGVEPLTEAVMACSPNLKAIARAGIGMDSVDQDAADKLGIKVSNTPDAPTIPVAEITLGSILCVLRGIHLSEMSIRSGGWERPMGGLLGHRTVGVLGLGRIGQKLVELLKPFGCKLIGHDPYAPIPEGVESVSLEELYKRADLISLHVPYNEKTHHLINGEAIQLMPKGTIIVNYARGGLIDEAALDQALTSGKIGGAAIDCFEKEPYTGVLKKHKEVVLTAHVGSYAREGRVIMESLAVENLLADL